MAKTILVQPDVLGDAIISMRLVAPLSALLKGDCHDSQLIWATKAPYLTLTPAGADACLATDKLVRYIGEQKSDIAQVIFVDPIYSNPGATDLHAKTAALKAAVEATGVRTVTIEQEDLSYKDYVGMHEIDARNIALCKAGFFMEPAEWAKIDYARNDLTANWIARRDTITAKPYAVLHLAASGTKPTLAPKLWSAIASYMKETGLQPILWGNDDATRPDYAQLNLIGERGTGTILDNKGSIADMADLLAHPNCRMFVGRDSGPAHLAAALGTLSIAAIAPIELLPGSSAKHWIVGGEQAHSILPDSALHAIEGETVPEYHARAFSRVDVGEIYSLVP